MSVARAAKGKAARLARSAGAVARESMGVGRGGRPPAAAPKLDVPKHLQGVGKAKGVLEIPTDLIVPDPKQPRQVFQEEALQRLAESLKAKGQLQPVRVVLDARRGRYLIVAGERRWRAARIAGLKTLVCTVVDHRPTVAELRADQLAENCAREDLGPIELGEAIDHLIGSHGWSQAQVARETGLSASAVNRALAIRMLPEAIRDLVARGAITASTAYELAKIADHPAKQQELARDVANDVLNHAGVVRVVKRLRDGGGLLTREPGEPASRTAGYVDPEADRTAFAAAAGGLPTVPPEPARNRAALQVATSTSTDETGGGGGPAGKDRAEGPAGMPAPTPAPPPVSSSIAWHDASVAGDSVNLRMTLPDLGALVGVKVKDDDGEGRSVVVEALERATVEARKRLNPERAGLPTRWYTTDADQEIWGYDLPEARVAVRCDPGTDVVAALRSALAEAERQRGGGS